LSILTNKRLGGAAEVGLATIADKKKGFTQRRGEEREAAKGMALRPLANAT
jgi:hypothetical protein